MRADQEKALRAETVSILVEVSRAFAATPGHRALKHWSRIQSSLEASLTGVGTFGMWIESFRNLLNIQAPNSSLCSALEALERTAEDVGVDFYSWLYLVRREPTWFVVQVRLESEKRTEAREQRRNEGLIAAVLSQPEPPTQDVSAATPRRRGKKAT